MNTTNAATKPDAQIQRMPTMAEEIDQRTERFQAALPPHIPVAKFKSVLTAAINRAPDLVKADRRSFFNSATQCANDGLVPDGREAALVVYNNKVKTPEGEKWLPFVQYLPMVAGIMKKVRNSGEIANWQVYAVHKNDEYDIIEGFDADFQYKRFLDGDPGPLKFCASLVTFKSGEKSLEIMTVFEIDKIRARSKVKSDFGPWKTDYEEMCKKTVIKRHSKRLPMNTDALDVIRRDDALYDFEGQSDRVQQVKRPQLSDYTAAVTGGLMDANPKAQVMAETEDDEAPAPAIADHDPDTGEVVDDEAAAAAADEFGPPEAMAQGREARDQNKPKRVPQEWRDNQAFQGLATAWIEGWDSRDAELAAEAKKSAKTKSPG